MKLMIIAIACIGFSCPCLFARQPIELSLQACVQIAVERNINMQTARIEHEKSGHQVGESLAALLPKVNINGGFQDNLSLPVTLLSGEFAGQPGTNIVLKIGSNYVTNATLDLNMALYNKTMLTALQIAKKMKVQKGLGVEKAAEELALEVSKIYFLSLTTARQIALVEENIVRSKQLSEIVKVWVDNGMGKQVDYDRVSVNLENLYTRRSNTETALEQQLNLLKYMLEIPLEERIILTDTAEMPLLIHAPEPINDFSSHIDIRMLESEKEINRMNQRMITAGYLPTLSLSGQYSQQGLRQNFGNYFQSNPENQWFASSYIGISLKIPVFDGMEKRSKSRQAKLDYIRSSLTLDNAKESFSVNYQNARNNYRNHQSNVQRQKQNIALAEKVYLETSLKYREGLATMSDLLQDEMGLNNAQANYLSALYNYKEAELSILSLNGEIRNLINQ